MNDYMNNREVKSEEISSSKSQRYQLFCEEFSEVFKEQYLTEFRYAFR